MGWDRILVHLCSASMSCPFLSSASVNSLMRTLHNTTRHVTSLVAAHHP